MSEPLTFRDVPATFPLDLDAFIAGLDSPNHSEASRRDWCRLFYRDMQRAATPPPLDVERLAEWLHEGDAKAHPVGGGWTQEPCQYHRDWAAGLSRLIAAPVATPPARPTAHETIRSALKGARGLALDSGEPDLDAELGRAIDLLDGLA